MGLRDHLVCISARLRARAWAFAVPAVLGAAVVAHAAPGPPSVPEVPADLTLHDALRLALAHSPELRAVAWEKAKADGRVTQAGLRPNPELSFDVENLGGDRSGISEAEATLSLEQTFELGGKRSARRGVAEADRSVVAFDLETRRIEVASDAATTFLRLLALQSAGDLATEEIAAAEEAAATTAQRVRSGAAHPAEERRAEVELANARLERILIEERIAVNRARLASLWGSPAATFARPVGALEPPPVVPDLDTLLARLEAAPAVARWKSVAETRRQTVALERAQRIPPLGVGGGVRSLGETDETTFVFGVSMPLPLFDRNQGATAGARAALEQARDEEAGALLGARRGVHEAHGAAVRSRRKLDALRDDVLPGATRAYADMREGFERGRFTYLDLLEARRTRIRARREDLEALLELHLARTELARVTAGSIASLMAQIGGRP